MLLSLSEIVGFAWAYALAAFACSSLAAGYAAAALKARRGLLLLPALALLYAYLYVALSSEDYALLIGSVGLLAMLAAAMAATRRIDWYGRQSSLGPRGGAPSEEAPGRRGVARGAGIGRRRAAVTSARLRVAFVYGGRSAERDVSLMSARAVASALDASKYELVLIGIDAEGRWSLGASGGSSEAAEPTLATGEAADFAGAAGLRVALTPDGRDSELVLKGVDARLRGVDLIFPVLHGPCGEDGSIQGLARLADLPCVGADILGSALCMDKDAAKRMLREARFPWRHSSPSRPSTARGRLARKCVDALGWDLFVKPANLGSSVGVSRARTDEEYDVALELAFAYDTKVLVEKTMAGREIEVAVLGDRELRASLPGEVIPRDGFYSYEAKYLDEDGARIVAPARLGPRETEACRLVALDACKALCVRGMARVDLFLGPDGLPSSTR